MNVRIRDIDAVKAIRPLDAASYLRAGGWESHGQPGGRSILWVRSVEDREFEALLPMDSGLTDYALRMGELLAAVSAAEGRSQLEIYRDLLTADSDVTRLRLVGADLSDGSIPIEEYAVIAQRARDLVMAAACATIEKRQVYPTRKPADAVNHVAGVRIGQSERGSYVIPIITSVAPRLEPRADLFDEETPYARRVTLTLARSLEALARAAGTAGLARDMAAFDEAVDLGVSANLCEALAGLWQANGRGRALDFSFALSPSRPAPEDLPRHVSFPSDRVPVIREAGRIMREKAPMPDFELHGAVVKLEKGENAPAGRVTVARYGDDGPRRVVLELAEPEYTRALDAHRDGRSFRAVGELRKEGRSYTLSDARDVGPLDE